ncbi:3249_t:CDS:2, partial [Racocetra fulgida]
LPISQDNRLFAMSASASDDPLFVKSLDTEDLITFLQEQNLELSEKHFDVLRGEKIMEAHRKFYKYLDEVINDVEVSQQVRKRARELLEQKKISSMATVADIELKYDPQENIENQIPEVISQEKALSFIPPIIEFSSFASTSKTTTSAVGKAPRKVLLWKEFFEKVNGYKFDVNPKFKKPEFHYSHLLNKESTVLTATDVNINMILNEIMGKNYDFSDRLAYIPGSDFTCYYMEETLILIMEIKRKHLFEDMNEQTFLEFYA